MYNDTITIGRLTKSPQLKISDSNIEYCYFTVADNEFYNGKKFVNYVSFIAYGKTAVALSKKLSQGDLILVKGSLYIDKYSDHNIHSNYELKCKAHFIKLLAKYHKNDEINEFVIEEAIGDPGIEIPLKMQSHEK